MTSPYRHEHGRFLQQALVVEVDAKPEWRLANLVMQRSARWLLAHANNAFLE